MLHDKPIKIGILIKAVHSSKKRLKISRRSTSRPAHEKLFDYITRRRNVSNSYFMGDVKTGIGVFTSHIKY